MVVEANIITMKSHTVSRKWLVFQKLVQNVTVLIIVTLTSVRNIIIKKLTVEEAPSSIPEVGP